MALIAAAILVAVLPAALLASAAPAELSPDTRLEARRLTEVRERLERRRALQEQLQNQVHALAAEIEALSAQAERTSGTLETERRQARAVEQRLDRMVPRLLARMAEVDQGRAQAAAALAQLARKSQSLHLSPRVRARLLALGPLLVERVRALEQGAAAMRAAPERMIVRQARIERSLPELTSAQRRLRQDGVQKRRLRQMASDRLRELEVEVRLLGEQEARLVHRLQRDEAALLARAEPRPDQRALRALAGTHATPGSASVDKGSAGPIELVAQAAGAGSRAAARAVVETPGSDGTTDAAELALDAGRPITPPAKVHADARRGATPSGWPGASDDAVTATTALQVLFSANHEVPVRTAGRARPARSTPPLLPIPEGPAERVLVAHGGPELTIPAAPGQTVAAPAEGRVVFAGRFRSYGLLLILEHEGEYHTLLWGFARLDVHHGDAVEVGQIVGIMDARGDDPPVLHVERRRNGRPVDIAASSNGIQG